MPFHPRFGLCLLVSALLAAATSAARADCSVGGLSGIVNGVTIVSATPVASPASCDIVGRLATSGEGAGPGAAGFELVLPADWNEKLLFWGVGGLAGSFTKISANPVDQNEAQGYATVVTDEGHQGGNTDAGFTLLGGAKGRPDLPARVDYEYRATHQVTLAAKALVAAFYDKPARRAYFDGCSNGGRQAMVEATRYPADFDGIVAGAPFLDLRVMVAADAQFKALFATSDSYLAASDLPAIDAKVMAACDAADGVADGLIQNPAACSVKPQDLGLRPGQTAYLTSYLVALRDPQGHLIYPGHAITDFADGGMDHWFVGTVAPSALSAAEPWGNAGFEPAAMQFQLVDHILQDYVELDPAYDYRAFAVSPQGVVREGALATFDSRTVRADAASPAAYDRFIAQGRKLIWYHGLSDPALPAFRDFVLYERMAQRFGGYEALRKSVRFFAVPDMQHCGGGPGPNAFRTLGPLEAWVEQGRAPGMIVASRRASDGAAPDRSMPLCPFPTQATYGGGDVRQAASWSCAPNTKMLDVGADGALAGLTPAR